MDPFKNLLNYWTGAWRGWSAVERASVVGGLLFCVLVIAGVAYWAAQPEYVTLANQLAPADSAEVVSALTTAGIRYQLNFAGSAVLVPRTSLNEARLAIKDVAPAAASGEESQLDSGLWADPAVTQVRLQREQEQRLARSIARVHGVKSATVHLTRPEYSPFIRDRGVPKASVVLDLQPGVPFTATDAQSIIALVAHSVENLEPERVSVMDTSGRHLSASSGLRGDIAGRLEFQHNLEAQLAAKAETMLAQWLGPGRAVVRVTADIDFTEIVRKETSYDPSGKVKVSEEIETTTETTAAPSGAGGRAAGTTSNIGSVSGDPARASLTAKKERNNTRYENARVEDTVTEAPGKVKRLTVAAVVHMPQAQSEEGAATAAPDRAAVEAIIKQAVGFDPSRNDGIEVMLANAPVELAPSGGAASFWEQSERLLRASSLGLAALASLVCGYLLLRRLSPVVVEVPSQDGLSVEAAQRMAELTRRAQSNPEAAAKVLATWLEQPREPERARKAA